MGVSLYLVFYNKFLRPTKQYKLILLALVFLAYLFMGAYVFREMNVGIELRERAELLDFKQEFINQHPCISGEDLDEFISLILNASDSGVLLLDRVDQDVIEPNWVFGGETIFFAFTLLATIGYGHLAPLTQNGKLFCILYTIVGVPMSCLLFASIVDRLVRRITRNLTLDETAALLDAKRFGYRNYSTIINRARAPNVTPSRSIYFPTFVVWFLLILLIYLVPACVLSNFTEFEWSFLDSIYYIYISITTIGFGDLVPGEEHVKTHRDIYRLVITGYLFVGIIMNMLFLNLMIRLPLFSKIYVFLTNLRRRRRHYQELSANDSVDGSEESLASSSSTSSLLSSPPTHVRSDCVNEQADSRSKTKII